MKITNVMVPAPILLHRHLTPSAKLLWMFLQLEAGLARAQNHPSSRSTPAKKTPGLLETRSGLARHTVLRGLSQLESAGLLTDSPNDSHASVPSDLLVDKWIGIREKVLYGTLQLTDGFQGSTGQFTYQQLSSLIGVSPETVKQAVRTLQYTGWLQISQRNKLSPIHFVLRNPAADQREEEVAKVKRRLEQVGFTGESIMREYLSLIVNSDHFMDNSSPGFLVEAYREEKLRFHRYYYTTVAFDFRYHQQDTPVAGSSNAEEANRKLAGFYVKVGICATRGLKLIVLYPEHLTLEVICQKVNGLLPLRPLDDHEPVIAYLEAVSRAHRKKALASGA